MHTRQRGFTLIELLVVIAIIGILSSVVLASLNSARAKANDAKRYSDLHQLANALELYYSSNGTYPATSATIVSPDLAALAPNYISALPHDPTQAANSSLDYRYCGSASNGAYTLLALTQKTGNWCSISNGADQCTWSVVYTTRCGQ